MAYSDLLDRCDWYQSFDNTATPSTSLSYVTRTTANADGSTRYPRTYSADVPFGSGYSMTIPTGGSESEDITSLTGAYTQPASDTYINGSTIEFMGGDEENRVHGFQGNIAHLNEPYKFGLEAFDQIDMRTSDFIIIDWNPKNNHWIDEVARRENAIVIHSTFKDNPFIPEEQKKKILYSCSSIVYLALKQNPSLILVS